MVLAFTALTHPLPSGHHGQATGFTHRLADMQGPGHNDIAQAKWLLLPKANPSDYP